MNINRSLRLLFVAFLLSNALLSTTVHADTVWIEGEAAVSHDYKKHGWYDAVRKDVFSGGEWLSHYDQRSPGTATYRIQIEKPGDHTFWLRCNYFKAAMEYRLDGGSWKTIDLSRSRDTMMISQKPDHRFIGWVKVGQVRLRGGKHELELRISSKLANHGGVDCFCLTDTKFLPSGTLKPSVQSARASGPSDWFPVVFDDDSFSAKSVIDMSDLLHRPAGKFGFLERRGKHIYFARSKRPIKFRGAGCNVTGGASRREKTQRVRYLAKHGINMVRQHSMFSFLGPLRNGRLDKRKLDQYDWWFAELKKHGIYITWSVFYPLRISGNDGYDPELFAELEKGSTSGLVSISRPLQDLQLAYVKKLLEHRNPYTGLAYRDDPALAVLEIQNEDCIFFHNPLNDLAGSKRPEHSRLLRRMFCDWARRRYKNDAALRSAWKTRESLASGELKLYGAWELKGDRPDRRKGDFIRFLTELQRGFYARRERESRDLGFKGVTVTTAWRSGGPAADAANLYCDAAMDMIDRHNYFGGGAGRHTIQAGPVRGRSHLEQAGSGLLASGFYQIEDRPFSVTEWTQSPPNQWKAEAAPLIAFYGIGLQGWDASYHFGSARARLGDGWPGLSYYVTDTPHYIGQFPALAFAVHKGHIKEAPIAAARRLSTDDLFRGVDPLQQDFTGGGHDEKALQGYLATPREILAVGRVTVSFDGKRSAAVEWGDYWDRKNQIVRSMTGELHWDQRQKLVLLTAPKTQAIIGFAGGTRQKLPGVSVRVKTPFVSLIFSPLDDRELVRSSHILITALARDRQSGARYADDGRRLEKIGGPPLLMEPVEATIALKGKPPRTVNVLDVYGVATGDRVPVENGAFAIDGTYRTYYYEVRR